MILRRLMLIPRFGFSQTVQSVDGTPLHTQATNPPLSPTTHRVDTLALSSQPLRKPAVSKLLPTTSHISATSSKSQQPSEKSSRTLLSVGVNKNKSSTPSQGLPTTTKSQSTSSTPSLMQAGNSFHIQTLRTIKNHQYIPPLLQNSQQRRRHSSNFSSRPQARPKRESPRLT